MTAVSAGRGGGTCSALDGPHSWATGISSCHYQTISIRGWLVVTISPSISSRRNARVKNPLAPNPRGQNSGVMNHVFCWSWLNALFILLFHDPWRYWRRRDSRRRVMKGMSTARERTKWTGQLVFIVEGQIMTLMTRFAHSAIDHGAR